jgi:deoxyribonuclease-4
MAKQDKLLLGAHVSIAGGVHKAIERGADLGCSAIQIFTKNATRWKAKPLSETEIPEFKRARERTGIMVVAHGSYLINIASPDPDLWRKSTAGLEEETERAGQLEIPFLILHPGAHKETGEKEGLARVIRGLDDVLAATEGSEVMITVENTAGQGTVLGYSFEHLAEILRESDHSERLGVCLDTCHAFAAGYDMTDRERCAAVIEEFDRVIGLDRLKVLHLNDSKQGLGSRIDRHEHIGMGALGLECFRLLMTDERFRHVPKLIETPNKLEGRSMDPVNLGILREMAAEGRPDG